MISFIQTCVWLILKIIILSFHRNESDTQNVPACKQTKKAASNATEEPYLKTLFLPGHKHYLWLPLSIIISMDKYATFSYSFTLKEQQQPYPMKWRFSVFFIYWCWFSNTLRLRGSDELFWNTRSFFTLQWGIRSADKQFPLHWAVCHHLIPARALWESSFTRIGPYNGCTYVFAFMF